MILEILLGALVGAAIAANWDSIVSWLSDLVTKLKGQSFFLCGQGPKPLPSVI